MRPADADDAGGLGSLRQLRPTDADDAGGLGSLRPTCAQLMLMMLAVWGLCVQSAPSGCS